MRCAIEFLGTALIAELQTSDRVTVAVARTWIARKSGHRFDPEAMYQLSWSATEDSSTWAGFVDLQVHIMSDVELELLEVIHRRRQGLPKRRPWEQPLFASSMGRAGGPR